jgi:hypothetical protein
MVLAGALALGGENRSKVVLELIELMEIVEGGQPGYETHSQPA